MAASALLDGPKTIAELAEHYSILGRRFGLLIDVFDRGGKSRTSRIQPHLESTLEILRRKGWVKKDNDRFHITEEGRREAETMLRELERSRRVFEMATHPERVSMTTLIVHFVLAAVKLPAALLSGSIGLLNDSLDTLMDGVSSLFVYLGVRSGRERLVSYVLLGFMGVTGIYTLYGAVSRLIHPRPLDADWTAFIAVAVSAVFCVGLWLYQKYSGIKHGSVPLVAQSIDSRNHVIVAGGVAAGLVAAALRFPRLDGIVGVGVAGLILKGAGDLLLDLLRSSGDEEIDLSRYGFVRLDRHRHRQMIRWLLYGLKTRRIDSRQEMIREARAATDYGRIASLRALGLHQQPDRDKRLESAVAEIFQRGLAEEVPAGEDGSPAVRLTEEGKEELRRALADSWNLSTGRRPLGAKALHVQALVLGFRLILSAGLFFVICASGRWVVSLLPDLDIWAGPAFPLIPGLEGSWLLHPLSLGPISLTGAQALLAAAGLGLFHGGRMLMHRASHAVHHSRSGQEDGPARLVVEGVFAVRRHPMAAGIILVNLGLALGLHSIYILAWAGLVAVLQPMSVRSEEKGLRKRFPTEYSEYSNRVKCRFFPGWNWVLLAALYLIAWMGI